MNSANRPRPTAPASLPAFAAVLLLAALWAPAPSQALVLTQDGNDFILLYSSGYYLTVLPDQGITSFAQPHLGAIGQGEPLYIIAHGREGSVHDMTAEQLVDFFDQHGLPRTVEKFFLFSCEAGLGNPSLVEQTGELLRQQGWSRATVVGAKGCAVTNRAYFPDENSEQVVRPDSVNEMIRLQWQLEQLYEPQMALDQEFLQWSLTHGGTPPDLRQRAEMAAANTMVRRFFLDLLAQANHDGYVFPRGQGFQVSSYVMPQVPLSSEVEDRNLCIDFGDAVHEPSEVCYSVRWFSLATPAQYLQQATALQPPLTYGCASWDGKPCAYTFGECQVYSIDGVENRGDSLWIWEIDGQAGALSACIYNIPNHYNRITWRYTKVHELEAQE